MIKKVDYYLHLLAINEIIALALQWCLRPIWPLLLSRFCQDLLQKYHGNVVLVDELIAVKDCVCCAMVMPLQESAQLAKAHPDFPTNQARRVMSAEFFVGTGHAALQGVVGALLRARGYQHTIDVKDP